MVSNLFVIGGSTPNQTMTVGTGNQSVAVEWSDSCRVLGRNPVATQALTHETESVHSMQSSSHHAAEYPG